MGININSSGMTMYLTKPDGETIELGKIEEADLTQVGEDEYNPVFLDLNRETEFELSLDAAPELDMLVGEIPNKMTTTLKFPCGAVPIRRNKKKRIQKKWNKRYGMRTIYIYKDYEVEQNSMANNGDGTFTFDLHEITA